MARVQHWRWEYRLRERPHVLVVAQDDLVQPLRLTLQSRWLLTTAGDPAQALVLASALLPSQCVIDADVPDALLLVERLKRERSTLPMTVVFLARSPAQAVEAQHRGAEYQLVIGLPVTGTEMFAVHEALLLQYPTVSGENAGENINE